jgi:transposase
MERFLNSSVRTELLSRHRRERDGRIKDRIKVVLLRDDGWSYESIAEALFLSDEGVRQQIQDYIKSDGIKLTPENGGSKSFLTQEQTQAVVAHLESHLYVTVSDICHYMHKTYNVRYSVSGMTDWLEKNKFTFHKPCGVPSKANPEAQTKFVAYYEKLKRDLPEEDHIIFMDGVHPTHAVRFTKGWIKKGLRKEIPTNGSQKRLNILGALDLEKMKLHNQSYETINGANIIAFLVYLLGVMPCGIIHVILDQARYHTCKEVKGWLLLNPRIRLHYLPPYSPNLNAIEPCWKIMHEHTTNNIYHPSFKDFTEKIFGFLNHTFQEKALSWTDRLTDNFRIMGSTLAS